MIKSLGYIGAKIWAELIYKAQAWIFKYPFPSKGILSLNLHLIQIYMKTKKMSTSIKVIELRIWRVFLSVSPLGHILHIKTECKFLYYGNFYWYFYRFPRKVSVLLDICVLNIQNAYDFMETWYITETTFHSSKYKSKVFFPHV